MRKKIISAGMTIILVVAMLTGCDAIKEKERNETVTVYLWSTVLYNKYAPYIQLQLPDINIQFVVGLNDLDFYKFMNENGELPDIIMSRRFSRHDAMALKDQLMNLSTTVQAGAIFESYLRDFTNEDGTINWLPICGVGDGIVANKGLFEQNHIPLPTDYDSFVSACQEFEELGIIGFTADFIYDYTCMEVLQGISIPEITSMEGSMWRRSYEDPEQENTGLDEVVWPVVFENMEQFIKDVNLGLDEVADEWDYDPIMDKFKTGQIAMIRAGSDDVVRLNEEGTEAVFLPYFGQNGEQWMLTYPEFQIAVNKDVKKDASHKEITLQVLSVMLSEGAQKTLFQNKDVVSYNKNINLELSPYLSNIQSIIDQNHLYIRIASNDFFAISKEVVQKMIRGEYDAKQAYEAFDRMLRQPMENDSETILTLKKNYSNIFYKEGGNEAGSAMANSLRTMYASDVVIAAGNSFTGAVFSTDYTEKQVASMIMPNNLFAYHAKMTGSELKKIVQYYVEGIEGGFKPFNRGSLPVLAGISIIVGEKDGNYSLLEVKKDGKEIKDDDTFRVTCVNTTAQMTPFLELDDFVFEQEQKHLRINWTDFIKEGGTVAEPEKYIIVKEDRH